MADFGAAGAREKHNGIRGVIAFYCRHMRQSLAETMRMRRADLRLWYREIGELVREEWEVPGE